MSQKSLHLEAAKAPLEGMLYFLLHPRLWFFPLLDALLSALFLLGLCVGITIGMWPGNDVHGWRYALDVFRAFGIGTVGSLVLWAFVFPFILALFFEGMLRRILRGEKESPKQFVGLTASMMIVLRTMGIRIFWPIAGLICALFLGPVGILISQIGIGHLAMIDAVDLTLALKNQGFKERFSFYKKKRLEMFIAGAVGGAFSLLLGPTFIGWIFWIPGVYVGALLWIQRMEG